MIYKTQWQAQRREQPERAPIKAILWNGNRFKSRGKRSILQAGQYVSVRQLITRHSLFNSSLIMLEIPRLITCHRRPAARRPSISVRGRKGLPCFFVVVADAAHEHTHPVLSTSTLSSLSSRVYCPALFLLRSQKYLKCFDYVCLARHGEKSKCYLCTRLTYEKTRGSGREKREGTQIPLPPTLILLPHHVSRPAPAPFPPFP